MSPEFRRRPSLSDVKAAPINISALACANPPPELQKTPALLAECLSNAPYKETPDNKYPNIGYPEFAYILVLMGSSTSLHTMHYRAFLTRLRQARTDAGMTQAQLAQAIGRSQTWVSKCELGERRVDVVELSELAEALGKPLVWFTPRIEASK